MEWVLKNCVMSTTLSSPASSDAIEQLRATIDQLVRGERDSEARRQACVEMDAAREEIRKRVGTVEMAVELIRDARQ